MSPEAFTLEVILMTNEQADNQYNESASSKEKLNLIGLFSSSLFTSCFLTDTLRDKERRGRKRKAGEEVRKRS